MTLTAQDLLAAIGRVWPGQPLPEALSALGEALMLTTNSKEVVPGAVFVAVPGSQRDGRDFIDAALAAEAGLVLAHARDGEVTLEGRVLWLPHLAQRLGELGKALFEVPDTLDVIAVTGTNGKSSVTHYIAALSEALGVPAGVVGTLGAGRPGQLRESGLTTPGPLALQQMLGELAAEGVTRVALEASSHALDQQRLDAVAVSAGVFTNLSRDHLDYHGSMAAYAAAKAKLFRRPELRLAVVNGDDKLARLMLAGCDAQVRVLASGEDEAVTLRVLDWQAHSEGQRAMVATPEGERMLELPLMGRFNLDNVLLAIAVLLGKGESLDALFAAAAHLTPVAGRMELYTAPNCPSVVIDYAHTPDALGNALKALRAHRTGQGALWCLFGCGGDRDTGKRPEMAKAAARYADRIVVTDDNPRSESAEAIRQMILAGFDDTSAVSEQGDRREAIAYAIAHAQPDDVILVAGKGHERYQEIAGVRHPYSDVDEVARALDARRAP